MPTDCIWFPEPPEGPWQAGWCFPRGHEVFLSKHYLQFVAHKRPPITVVLPTRGGGTCEFCIDSHPSDSPDGNWTVTVVWPLEALRKPDITVSPSINVVGLYHGFLAHGQLTDDLG